MCYLDISRTIYNSLRKGAERSETLEVQCIEFDFECVPHIWNTIKPDILNSKYVLNRYIDVL